VELQQQQPMDADAKPNNPVMERRKPTAKRHIGMFRESLLCLNVANYLCMDKHKQHDRVASLAQGLAQGLAGFEC
jgi:hypothetical protein